MHKLVACAVAVLAAASSALAAPVPLTKVGSLPVSWGREVAATRGTVYLTQGNGWNGIDVVDVTVPAAPRIVTTIPGGAADLAVVGRTLYAGSWPELVTYDITNPQSPVSIGSVTIVGAKRFAAAPGFLYVAASYPNSLRVVSVADPTAPVQIGAVALPFEPQRVAVSGAYAYVADGMGGLHVIDVADPASPRDVAALAVGNAVGVAASGSYAYVTEHGFTCEEEYCGPIPGNLHAIDVSVPECPREIAVLARPQAPDAIVIDGRQVYITEASVVVETPGVLLTVVDVTNPAAPVDVAYYPTPQASEVAVANGYVYAPAWFEMSVLRAWSGTTPIVCPVP